MKTSKTFGQFSGILTVALLIAGCGLVAAGLQAQSSASAGQRTFASPDDAVQALQAAATNEDRAAMQEIFGPDITNLMTGDKVQDANNRQRFAASMSQGCNPVTNGENQITLEIGTNGWPMPIPLVMADGQLHFDTAAGKQTIIERHIGKDELCAIGVCRAYVPAQKQYADMNPKAGGGAQYAMKFKSDPGKKDGLYWPESESPSPFGPLVAQAQSEGYGRKLGTGRHPFHGYYFRILTRQGRAAPGGAMSYMSGGLLTGGFALVAYPAQWNQSGIMTFIVNQDGKVYQKNLGPDTPKAGAAMKAYNPDDTWELVADKGEQDSVVEK